MDRSPTKPTQAHSLPPRVRQTLIRNLRDSSTRVMLARPALWQMETVLVDQAVEKFNLGRDGTRAIYSAMEHE